MFMTLEWLGRLGLLAALYAFVASFVADRRARRLAMILALGTLGLTLDPYLEVNSFGILLSAPHLMFGLALTLACAPLYLRAIAGSARHSLLLGTAVLGLSL